jgi:hypothetical protein
VNQTGVLDYSDDDFLAKLDVLRSLEPQAVKLADSVKFDQKAGHAHLDELAKQYETMQDIDALNITNRLKEGLDGIIDQENEVAKVNETMEKFLVGSDQLEKNRYQVNF